MPRKSTLALTPLNMGSIGSRIAFIRQTRGLTQTELAKIIGITQGLVSEYESDKLRLYDKMLARFAIALEVTTDEIVGLSPPEVKRVHYSVTRRMKRLSELPVKERKSIFSLIDILISGAERRAKKEKEKPEKPIANRVKTGPPNIKKKKGDKQTPKPRKSYKKKLKMPVDQDGWNKYEIEILEIFYPQSPEKIILDMLKNKTWMNCVEKAKELKIRRRVVEEKRRYVRKKDKIKYYISLKELKRYLYETNLTIEEIAKKMRTTPDIIRRNIFKNNL